MFGTKVQLVVASALASAAIAALAMTGGSGAATQRRSLTLVATSSGGFEPKNGARPGAVSGFFDRLGTASGRAKGRDVGICTLISDQAASCRIQLLLDDGQLSVEGVLRESAKTSVFVVTGGSGAYRAAGGEARVTHVSDTRTRIVLALS